MAVWERAAVFALPDIDRRFLVGGVLAGATALLLLLATQPPDRVPVLVAGGDLPAGVPLQQLDVGVRYVEGSDGLVVGSELGDLDTWTLSVPIEAGEPLLGSVLRPPQMTAAPNVLAIALPAQHAVLGQLFAGDLVDVYLTSDSGVEGQSETGRIATDVFVVDASMSDAVSQRTVELLIAVDDELAALITSAAHRGQIDLVRVNR